MLKKLLLLVFISGCTAPQALRLGGGEAMVARSNTVMAQEFVELTFRTETGGVLEGLLKYEGPIRVSLSANLSQYREDLEQVLDNIARGAGIDIAIGGAGSQIHVQQIPADIMKRTFPTAACVVASGVNSWAAFRRGESRRWTSQQSLRRAAVFIPDDAPPYIVRACLNEEIAQALGPVNDLFSVADTVFNDDNVHSRLTSFDLLMLRVLYDNRLQIGMNRSQSQTIAATILQDINPQGRRNGVFLAPDPQWEQAIETAMINRNSRNVRLAAARRAVELARAFPDQRLAHSLLIYGRLNLQNAPELAAPAFQEAYVVSLNRLGPDNLRTALGAMHIAAVALAAQRYDDVISLTNNALKVARKHQDTVLVAGIQSIRSLAFTALGRDIEATRARLDSLAQARYAFGDDLERIASAQAQVAGLVPANQ